MQSAVHKFMRIGLGFPGRPDTESEHFGKYFDYGLKVKSSQEIQDEYMEIVADRLKEIGLDMPSNVEPDYDMRFGYAESEEKTSVAAK